MKKKLIIELDGSQHAEQVAYDKQKTEQLVVDGFKVIRFGDNEIIDSLQSVLEGILKVLHTEMIHCEKHPSPAMLRMSASPTRGEAKTPIIFHLFNNAPQGERRKHL